MTTGPQSLSHLHIIAIEEDSTLDISTHLTEMYSNSGATRLSNYYLLS